LKDDVSSLLTFERNPTAMTYFVFVDFENVQKVDLALIEGKPVHVTLLIGKKQTWLDLTLVQQVRRLPAQVELLEVGASGHNALDLTLAYYLGRAVEQIPEATFAIVSKDKDFEPMIGHLTARGIQIVRKDSFAALPFLQPPKPAPATKARPPLKVVTGKPAPEPKPAPVKPAKGRIEDKLARLIKHLRNGPPTDRTKLEHTIADSYRKTPPPGGVPGVIALLVKQKVIAIDHATGKVAVL